MREFSGRSLMYQNGHSLKSKSQCAVESAKTLVHCYEASLFITVSRVSIARYHCVNDRRIGSRKKLVLDTFATH